MGCGQKASSFACRACPQEADTERGWTKGDHRRDEAALGGTPKGAVALIKLGRAEGRDHLLSDGAGHGKRKQPERGGASPRNHRSVARHRIPPKRGAGIAIPATPCRSDLRLGPSSLPGLAERGDVRPEIQPMLANVTRSAIATALGVSWVYAPRAGAKRAYPRIG